MRAGRCSREATETGSSIRGVVKGVAQVGNNSCAEHMVEILRCTRLASFRQAPSDQNHFYCCSSRVLEDPQYGVLADYPASAVDKEIEGLGKMLPTIAADPRPGGPRP